MPSEKIYKLVKKLKAQTDKGKVNWEESVEDGVYQVSFTNYSIKLSQKPVRRANQQSTDYVVTIYNEEGALLEEFSDVDLDAEVGTDYYDLMKSLYETARRYAMGAEQAIDSILTQLDDDIPF